MLKVGKIDYLNLYPVFENLKKCQFCEYISGEPYELNQKLRKGEIDISPSSSYEYLKNKSFYRLIDNFSISSRTKVLSVIFITKKKINQISNHDTIYLSPSSASSNSLIKIIFYEFFNIFPKFQLSIKNKLYTDNQLIIGDNALKIYFNSSYKKKFYIYDLAEIWYKYTNLPFVFALWIGNINNLEKKRELLVIFKKILKKSIRSYIIPKKYKNFTYEQISTYFQNIDYEFLDIHQKSLKLYGELLEKWKLF